MIDSLVLSAKTLDSLRRGAKRARLQGTPVLVSVREPIPAIDPLDVFAAAGQTDRFFWSPPGECGVAAIGVAHALAHVSAAETIRRWNGILTHAVLDAVPRLFGALPFDPSQPAGGVWQEVALGRLVLPRFAIEGKGGDGSILTINIFSDPWEEPEAVAARLSAEIAGLLHHRSTPSLATAACLPPDEDHFRRLVARAISAIRAGTMQKVAVARAQHVRGAWDPADVLRYLRTAYPRCVTFGVGRGEASFLGATPEWLVRFRGGEARVDCLAGTAPRGVSPDEDERLGAELLADRKNRSEHAFVLDELLQSLHGVADVVDVAPEPGLVKLPNLQHLFTPLVATVPRGNVLTLAERLHPTPAVAGTPRKSALAFLRAHEDLERGGYAGPVGWIDASGEGEFAVALRSAVLARNAASAFAGGGIVADSEPGSEFEETVLKLRPMLAALGAIDA